jgi:predicted AAA+ superfamily ATPase
MDLSRLYTFQSNLLRVTDQKFTRYLFDEIKWKQRMIGIRGLRGTGKTTMLLQHLKFTLKSKGLYVTADHPWFYDHSLVDLAEQFDKEGGKVLLIDEIHKYPNWSGELKNIYDGFPALSVIFTASSALQIQKGDADLSRRVVSYELSGFSFREYVNFTTGTAIEKIKLPDLFTTPDEYINQFPSNFKPLPLFRKYLQNGYFPFGVVEDDDLFFLKLNQVINTVLETDLATIEGYTAGNVLQIKKLLGVISESVPFTPNIAALAAKMKMGRDTVNNFLLHLERARLLNLLHYATKGVAALQKPDKIYLENTNLSFALKDQPDKGSLRETFFLNQIRNTKHEIHLAEQGDFIIDGKWTIEVGGKTKNDRQVKKMKNSFLALDDIEIPYQNRVPLWLFGFLY